MSKLLHEIDWEEPILPTVEDPAWEAELKRRSGSVPDVQRRIAPSPWLRRAYLELGLYRPGLIPARLFDILSLVTSQENACRYCYGAARAQMRILGYSDALISQIERQVQLAELEEKELAFIQFCRGLARSNPRPARADRDHLLALGFEPLAVTEVAFLIACGCFFNRVATFIACPPEYRFESLADGLRGKVLRTFSPVLRPLRARRLRGTITGNGAMPASDGGIFGGLVNSLAPLPAAGLLGSALEEAFASPVLSRRLKTLMFAVVSHALNCRFCQGEVRARLGSEGISGNELDACLATLTSPRLDRAESRILAWVRDTVHYEPNQVQKRTRLLAAEVGDAALLEAVGVASLANSTVRLAMLME